MKKLSTLLLFCIIYSITLFSQSKIDEVKLSNGKTIIVYSDNTWKYKETSNSGIKPVYNSSTNNSQTKGANAASSKTKTTQTSSSASYSGYCGAPTKKGGACKRRVSGGGRCWQHK